MVVLASFFLLWVSRPWESGQGDGGDDDDNGDDEMNERYSSNCNLISICILIVTWLVNLYIHIT